MTTHHKKNSHKAGSAQPAKKSAPQHSTPSPESHKPVAAVAAKPNTNMQIALIVALVIAAFFGAYRFAQASNSNTASAATAIAGAPAPAAEGFFGSADSAGAAGGGGCCGGGGAPVEGAATVEGDTQKIAVDLSSGSYNPNVIKLKAGVPTEITFGQSSGCTAQVQSAELGFAEDLTSGPKTVKLAALQAGTYGFACGMNMVTGQIVVE